MHNLCFVSALSLLGPRVGTYILIPEFNIAIFTFGDRPPYSYLGRYVLGTYVLQRVFRIYLHQQKNREVQK